jgi:hypothetical protein
MRQRFLYGAAFISALTAAMASQSPTLRSIRVDEDTPAPGTSASSYSLCATLDTSAFAAAIQPESNECAVKTAYMWGSFSLPTATERRELCSCDSLIRKLGKLKMPRCSLYKDGNQVSFVRLIEYAFGLCDADGNSTSAPSSTTSPGASPTRNSSSTAATDESNTRTSHQGAEIYEILISRRLTVSVLFE